MYDNGQLDPRRHAYRSDLAAASLREQVNVPRYVEGTQAQVSVFAAPVRRRPDAEAPLDTEALFGEVLTIYDERDGWAWVQLARDGYVGYVPSDQFQHDVCAPSHRVNSQLAVAHTEPNALSEPVARFPFNAQILVADLDEKFARLETGGFIPRTTLKEVSSTDPDYVATALRFVGLPYVYGGKSALGLDCSALVQTVLQAAGYEAPRDSDMQLEEIEPGVEIGPDLAGLQRGDIVFWPGHTGIMLDTTTMVHANALHMCVSIEPVCDVAERARGNGPVVAGVSRPGLASC